jgi:DNA (cytosine-5)-methyltransferase 1
VPGSAGRGWVLARRTKTPARAPHAASLFDGLIIDSFAGAGGASLGIEAAMGRAVDAAVNHDRQAVLLHQVNHPHTRHYASDVFEIEPAEVTGGRPVSLCWFSPDCKHFSRAKGSQPVSKRVRGLAWVVVKWAKAVRPLVIMLENVREFETWGPLVPMLKAGVPVLDRDGRPRMVPCVVRRGKTFRLWLGKLRRLGYAVEWRTLDAADYGAPTHRKRLFLVARCDGLAVRWPEPTHGPGRAAPYRTAAECIDWSLPTPSIFLTRAEARAAGVLRPLAVKTMRRIALGLKRFVLDNPRPFVVHCNHGGDHFRGQPVERPLATVTGRHGFGVVTPYLVQQNGEAPHQDTRGRTVDRPMGTVTCRSGGGFPLVVPHVTRFFGGVVGQAADAPLPTVTSVDHHGLVAASLTPYNGGKGSEVRAADHGAPLPTVDTSNRFGLVAAFLSKHYGDRPDGTAVPSAPASGPLPTVTARGTQTMLAAAHLVQHNFGDKAWSAAGEPLRTVTAGGNHHALVCSFLTKYFGTGVGQPAGAPLGTQTAKHRFGVVTVRGRDYLITDIGLRMLNPRELFRCQGFPDSYVIDPPCPAAGRGPPRRLPKNAQVRMCGNSVCPPVAEALVRANFPGECAPPAPARKARRRKEPRGVPA